MTAEDISQQDHSTVSATAGASKSVVPLGNKWSLFLSGRANVTATALPLNIVEDGQVVPHPIAPDTEYLLRVEIKRKNREGEFEVMSTGDNDTNGYVEKEGLVNLTSFAFETHMCLNRFELEDFKVEAQGEISNDLPGQIPDESASVSVAL